MEEANSTVTYNTTAVLGFYTVGTEARVECAQGFRLLGPSKLTCRFQIRWTDYGAPLPVCTRKSVFFHNRQICQI